MFCTKAPIYNRCDRKIIVSGYTCTGDQATYKSLPVNSASWLNEYWARPNLKIQGFGKEVVHYLDITKPYILCDGHHSFWGFSKFWCENHVHWKIG